VPGTSGGRPPEHLSATRLRPRLPLGGARTRPHPPQPPSTPPTPPRATGNPPPAASVLARLGAAGQRRRARTGRGPGDGQLARLLGCQGGWVQCPPRRIPWLRHVDRIFYWNRQAYMRPGASRPLPTRPPSDFRAHGGNRLRQGCSFVFMAEQAEEQRVYG
jgi:hypothetical protein